MTFMLVFLSATLCGCGRAHAQGRSAATLRQDTVNRHADVAAKFKGSVDVFFYQHFEYPDSVEDGISTPDRIVLSFTVDRQGYVRDAKVERSSGSNRFDANALKAVLAMNAGAPVWEPGLVDGKPVASRFYLPVIMHPEW